MLSNIKSATKDSIIYGFGNLSIKVVGVILIPLYTNSEYLSFDDFGRLGLLEAFSTLLTAVLGLSLTQGITRWYWDPQYANKQKSLVFSIILFLVIVCGGFLIICFPFSKLISSLLFHNAEFSKVIITVLIASVLQVFVFMTLTLLKLQQKPVLYTLTNITKLIFTLCITIYLVVYKKQSIQGIYTAQIVGNAIFILLNIKNLRKSIQFSFEKHALIDMLNYSYPLILASISAILLSSQDRYILNHFVDLNKVGIYSLAYRISNTIKLLVVSSVQMAVSPMLFQMLNSNNKLRFYSKYMTYFAFIVAGFTIALNLFSLEIVKLFTSDVNYWQAAFIIPLISIAIFFDMLKDTSLTGIQITKKTKIISVNTLIIAILNFVLTFVLAPFWGIYGAAVATLISEIIFFLLIIWFAQKQYKIPYEFYKIATLILFVSLFSYTGYLIRDFSMIIRLLLKSVILLSFPFLLKLFKFYEPIEIERLNGAIKKWSNPKKWKLKKNPKGIED